MCGINGFFRYDGGEIPNGLTLLKQMNQALKHRGPDGEGVWSSQRDGIYLGHRRLSIIDLSENGKQPMRSPNGRQIVYNGEIYNFASLRTEMPERKFISRTDTEVLLYMFEEYGQDCLNRLNGMFAFAVWDQERHELFLARDRIGIKPLYFSESQGIFSFSSEVKALLTLPWVEKRLDEESLYHFLTFNHVPGSKTMFSAISKCLPGHCLTVSNGGLLRYEKYWDVEYSDMSNVSDREAVELIRRGLEDSVISRLVSDVPVGVFLSGGVDSSAIVAYMAKHTGDKVRTFSVGFQGKPDYDELGHAQAIAKRFGTEHSEIIVTPQDIEEFLPHVAEIYDEPLSDATSIPVYFLSRLARESGTPVVLTGDGGDEAFSGYRRWAAYARLTPYFRFLSAMPGPSKRLVYQVAQRLIPSSPATDIFYRAAKGQEMFWGAGGLKEFQKRSILSDNFKRKSVNFDSYKPIAEALADYLRNSQRTDTSDVIAWMCNLGLKETVPNYYLHRADRMGMANSIELRVPFLDHRLVNLALSIPSRMKCQHGEPKYILKKALENELGADVVYRQKKGFCVPLKEWAEEFMMFSVERELKGFCRETGLFDEKGLLAQILSVRRGSTDYVFSLWNIYFLMAWFKRWILT